MRLTRLVLWGMVAAVGLTVLALVASLMFPLVMPQVQDLLPTGIFVVLAHGVAFGCAVAREQGRAPRLMLSGIGAAAAALVACLVMIWVKGAADFDELGVIVTWPTVWACLVMVIGLLLMPRPRPGWWIWMRRASFVLLVVLAAHICLAVTLYPAVGAAGDWDRVSRYEEIAQRIGGVLALLAGGLLVAVFLGVWVPGLAPLPARAIEARPYWLRCPRCHAEQRAVTGTSSCQRCGLRIRVEVS